LTDKPNEGLLFDVLDPVSGGRTFETLRDPALGEEDAHGIGSIFFLSHEEGYNILESGSAKLLILDHTGESMDGSA